MVAGSNPAGRAKLCEAKFGIEAALSNPTNRRIVAAEIPKILLQGKIGTEVMSGNSTNSEILCLERGRGF